MRSLFLTLLLTTLLFVIIVTYSIFRPKTTSIRLVQPQFDEIVEVTDIANTLEAANTRLGKSDDIGVWKVILSETLSEHQVIELSILPIEVIINDILYDASLYSLILEQILTLSHSEQRDFLLTLIADLPNEYRKEASIELLSSARTLDKMDGVSLIFSLDSNLDKQYAIELIINTEQDIQVLQYLLAALLGESAPLLTKNTVDDIFYIYKYGQNAKLRKLALQLIVEQDIKNIHLIDEIIHLISSSEPDTTFAALNLLTLQLNDLSLKIPDKKKVKVIEKLMFIAEGNDSLIKNAEAAKRNLTLIERYQ